MAFMKKLFLLFLCLFMASGTFDAESALSAANLQTQQKRTKKRAVKSRTVASVNIVTSKHGDRFRRIKKKGNLQLNLLIPDSIVGDPELQERLSNHIQRFIIEPYLTDKGCSFGTESVKTVDDVVNATKKAVANADYDVDLSGRKFKDYGMSISPTMINDKWVEFCVKLHYCGGGNSDFPFVGYVAMIREGLIPANSSYVASGKVLNENAVFNNKNIHGLLQLIKREWDKEYKDFKTIKFEEIPQTFSFEKYGMTFYIDGRWKARYDMPVFISYEELKPYLSGYFLTLLGSVDNWQRFDELASYAE